MKVTNKNVPVHLIDTEEKLQEVVNVLQHKKEIAFDTEFDSFNKQYGVHLQLVQIFDGETCYLIDPLKIKDLSPLWQIFTNEKIGKIVYSGANDVDILKRNGCAPKNLFDLQLATELCQLTARSLGAALSEYFNVELDKSNQAAGWGNRPLTQAQLNYAAQDVIYLFELKEILLPVIKENKVEKILIEKNIALEAAASKDYEPRLSDKQKKIFDKYSAKKLLELKILIDKYAQQLNVPPFKIVRDSILENMIANADRNIKDNFIEKYFHTNLQNNKKFKSEIINLVCSINSSKIEKAEPDF